MTLRDVEVIELLSDKPELLAIADAVSATQREPAQPRRRRVVVRAGLVAAAAAAVLVAVLAAPQGRPGVLGRALAAVGDGRIMHVVIQLPSGIFYVDLQTGHRTPQIFREELWADRQLDRVHVVLSLNGHVVGDVLWPKDHQGSTSASAPNPAFLALWTGYRAALQNGTAKLEGRGTVLGRHVYWLRFASAGPDQPTIEVAVDARSYKPILYRTRLNGRNFDQRILLAKAMAYDPSNFTRRGPNLFSGSSSGGTSIGPVNPSAPAKAVVTAPWLTAGKRVAGLRLSAANTLRVTSKVGGKQQSMEGLQLTYGPLSHGLAAPLSTTVEELPRPDDPRAWRHIPGGSMQVELGEESGSGGSHTLWTGKLRKDGFYVTIETSKGGRALLEIARALRRARD